jgi:hypothetical protein
LKGKNEKCSKLGSGIAIPSTVFVIISDVIGIGEFPDISSLTFENIGIWAIGHVSLSQSTA